MSGPDSTNIVWQTRRHDQTPYEDALAGALEVILGDGTHDLAGIVAGLNRLGVRTEAGEVWSEALFQSEIGRLGA